MATASWQLVNVWRRFARCRWDGARNCNASAVSADVAATNEMLRTFVHDLRASGVLERRGNGAFVHSCNEHVAGLAGGAFERYAIGGRSMRDALAEWWAAPDDAPPTAHTRLPCELGSAAADAAAGATAPPRHHQCNPTCQLHRAKTRLNQECPCDPAK